MHDKAQGIKMILQIKIFHNLKIKEELKEKITPTQPFCSPPQSNLKKELN